MKFKYLLLTSAFFSLISMSVSAQNEGLQLQESSSDSAAVCPTNSGILCKVYHLLFAGKKPAQVRAEMDQALAPHPENEPIKNELKLDEGMSEAAAVCPTNSGVLCKLYHLLFKGKKPAEVKAAVEKEMEGHPENEPLPDAPAS